MLKRITEYVDNNLESIISDLFDLVSYPSVSSDRVTNTECLKAALELGEKYGFNTYSTPEYDVGVIEYGNGGETVGILAHVDVVDIGDIEKWNTEPFKGHFDGKRLYGRGVVDDKGGVIAGLYAMKFLKDSNITCNKKIQLIIGTQEETVWTDIDNYLKLYAPPDYGFTPDGGFPIYNREKGYLDAKVKFNKGNNLNNSDIIVLSLTSGDSENSIPSKAEAIIEILNDFAKEKILNQLNKDNLEVIQINSTQYKVNSVGKSSHSSLPENGINAIEIICKSLASFSVSPQGYADMIAFVKDNFADDFYGKKLGFFDNSDYIEDEYVGYTTILPTIIKSVEDAVILNINLRLKIGQDIEFVKDKLSAVKDKYNFNIEFKGYLEPLFVSKDKDFLHTMATVYEEVTNEKNEFLLANGTSYAKAMPNIVSWGPVFPDQDDFCHQENEQIDLDLFLKAIHIYTLFLSRTCDK